MNQLNTIVRLGKDCEVKQLEKQSVINFSGALDVGYGNNKSTLWIEYAYFTTNTKIAEFLKKGTQVFVTGEIRLRTWESSTGKTGASIQCIVRDVKLLGGSQQQSNSQHQQSTQHVNVPDNEEDSSLPF